MQLHKRHNIDQVRMVLDWYDQKLITIDEALIKLGIKRRRFFSLLKRYRDGQLRNLTPKRSNAHRKVSLVAERTIRAELEKEKRLISDTNISVTSYNYRAVRDSVIEATGKRISAQTIRNRAKQWGYYLEASRSKTKHTRVVLTTAVGLLLQHDASHHLWSPFADQKWSLITTIDDYSRLLLFAELFEEETTWAHIQALKRVVLTYGVGSNYYTDNHSIFRFVEYLDDYWRTPRAKKQEVKTQWERAVHECGIGTIYALSPEAKGKVERPYRWLQDRVVRSCAKQNITTIGQSKVILAEEVKRYNTKQVHSTTGEIPAIRFKRAKAEGLDVFKPLKLSNPYNSTKDIFCLKEEPVVNGYGSIAWKGRYIELPKYIPEGARVRLHIIPDSSHPEIRVWYRDELVSAILLHPTQLKYREV